MHQKSIRRRSLPKLTQAQLEDIHHNPVIARLLASRGVKSKQETDYQLRHLLPPHLLLNIDKAANMLFKAISGQQNILIVGDFDADGATSSALMLKALRAMGAEQIDFLVPDRFHFGYGLSEKLVDYAVAEKKPDLIVTVDNGIANHAGVERANTLAVPVLITDHHLAAQTLPDAACILNPNQPGDTFPSKNLAGVGVAFYLCLALRAKMRHENWFSLRQIEEPNLAELLDIVALGTVADVVPLDYNNRILVEQGLRRIRAGQACAGIRALLKVAGRDERKVRASDLGFAVGPRLNAAGRLEDMSIGIRCLLANTEAEALPLAAELDSLNRQRRQIESDMLEEANAQLATLALDESATSAQRPNTLCLYQQDWHQGVIGILASRVKEKINRPVIIFAKDDSGPNLIKGSARSVKEIHIRDLLALVDNQAPGLINKFGGHAMAAGLTICEDRFEEFCELLEKSVSLLPGAGDIKDEIETDGALGETDFSLHFCQELERLGPWGQGFPQPVFDNRFQVMSRRIVGEAHLKLILRPEGKQAQPLDAIWFRCPASMLSEQGDLQQGRWVEAVFQPNLNEFRDQVSVQLIIEQLTLC